MRRRQPIILLALLALGMQPIPKPPELDGWIEAGDPRAVPVILERLRAAAARSHDDDTDRFYMTNMIRHAAMYQLDEAGPLMVRLYDRPAEDVDLIAYAAAEYRSEAAVGLQRTLLADPRVKDPDLRAELLIALAEMGDEKAADALAEWTLVRLAEIAETNVTSIAMATDVPATRSARFRERINAAPMPPEPTGSERDREAETLLRHRCLMEQLRTDLTYANASAEEVLAFVGNATAEQIPRIDMALRSLRKFAEPKHAALLAEMKLGKDGALEGEERIVSARRHAIAAIKRRHWTHYADASTTAPAD